MLHGHSHGDAHAVEGFETYFASKGDFGHRFDYSTAIVQFVLDVSCEVAFGRRTFDVLLRAAPSRRSLNGIGCGYDVCKYLSDELTRLELVVRLHISACINFSGIDGRKELAMTPVEIVTKQFDYSLSRHAKKVGVVPGKTGSKRLPILDVSAAAFAAERAR